MPTEATACRTDGNVEATTQDSTSLIQNFFLPRFKSGCQSGSSLSLRDRLDHIESEAGIDLTAARSDRPGVPDHGATSQPSRAPQPARDRDSDTWHLLLVHVRR